MRKSRDPRSEPGQPDLEFWRVEAARGPGTTDGARMRIAPGSRHQCLDSARAMTGPEARNREPGPERPHDRARAGSYSAATSTADHSPRTSPSPATAESAVARPTIGAGWCHRGCSYFGHPSLALTILAPPCRHSCVVSATKECAGGLSGQGDRTASGRSSGEVVPGALSIRGPPARASVPPARGIPWTALA